MGFLSGMIQRVDLEWPNDDISPFTESIIVATLCGRVLEHKQRPGSLSPQQQPIMHHSDRHRDPALEFCRRHRSLNVLLTHHMKMLQMQFPSQMENTDPTHIFIALSVCVATFMLYETIESNPLASAGAQASKINETLLAEHKKLAFDAINELGVLIPALGQTNHFQVRETGPPMRLRDLQIC